MTTTAPSRLRALARIFRLEYLAASLPGMSITFFLCATEPADLLRRGPLEGLMVVALVIFSCLGMNAIVDREIDGQYATEKSGISHSVNLIGTKRIWRIIATMNVIALAVTAALCIHFRSWIPLLLVLANMFWAYGYSVPPLQFKLRGVLWHAVSLTLAVCWIPFIFSAYTYLGTVPLALAIMILGFGLGQYGFEFANQALDYLEDKSAGLRTPAVRLGITKSLQASLLVPLAGLMVMVLALLVMYIQRSAQSDVDRPVWHVLVGWGLSVLLLLAGYLMPMVRTWQMLQLARATPSTACVRDFPGLCHYAVWQASSVTGVALASAVLFAITNYSWR